MLIIRRKKLKNIKNKSDILFFKKIYKAMQLNYFFKKIFSLFSSP